MRLEPHTFMLDGAVPIPAGAIVAYLASRPREAREFVLDLADAIITQQDVLDGDTDLEATNEDGGNVLDEPHDPEPDEPSLGTPEVEFTFRGLPERRGHVDQRRWSDGGASHGEDEPTLGTVDRPPSFLGQRFWSDGYQRKPEHDECDPRADEDCGVDDLPHDGETDQGEHTLGWSNNIGQLDLGRATEDGDTTAPERHGMGFVRCAVDDAEDGHDAEAVNEDGCDMQGSDNGIADSGGVSDQWMIHTNGLDYE